VRVSTRRHLKSDARRQKIVEAAVASLLKDVTDHFKTSQSGSNENQPL
jgi:hypothetical protein